MQNPNSSNDQLFSRYLKICNQALDAHKEEFPYKQLWHVMQHFLKGKKIFLSVYNDHPQKTYEIALKDDHLNVVDVKEGGDPHAWRMKVSELEKIVADPEEYIKNPSKIDWEWLKNRLD